MKILTPLESIMSKIEGKISKEDFFILQKEFLQAYAEGFNDGNKKSSPSKIKKSILSSNLWKNLDNKELLSIFD